ncbi:hypothetical protein [Marinimicrobium locisalis]|uniref:hypothetical protein n=1 Tax=Marinimicrobium locisalis TaxID=546022 RepID=UPI0032213A62
MKSYRFLISAIFLLLGAEALAETYAFRDSELYNIYGGKTPARITIFTFPVRPYEPVYSWRKHEYALFYGWYDQFYFAEGPLGYDGDYIGTTDQNGILEIYVEKTPDEDIYCGRYTNERFAVGQNSEPETDPISFKMYRKAPHIEFGPTPRAPSEKCLLKNM